MVFKFFKTMPTTATIRAVLARMGCQRIIPEALRTKRVGVDFIAVVQKNTEDAQEIVRNKTMLRGTDLYVGPDKYEGDWERKESGKSLAPHPGRTKPLAPYPRTELWEGAFKETIGTRRETGKEKGEEATRWRGNATSIGPNRLSREGI